MANLLEKRTPNLKHQIEENPDRPTYLVPLPDQMPEELRRHPIWLFWKAEWRTDKAGKGRWNKTPYCVNTRGRKARTNDQRTQVPYENAVEQWPYVGMDGMGIVLRNGFAGCDIDNCVGNTGTIIPEARAILEFLGSYCEFSPTSTGVKAVFKGSMSDLVNAPGYEGIHPKDLPNKKKFPQGFEVEFYDHTSPRYFTVTGHRVPGFPEQIVDCQERFVRLYRGLFTGEIPRAKETGLRRGLAAETQRQVLDLGVTDHQVLGLAMEARNGDKFRALYKDGDTSGYLDDASRADQALCGLLAFWVGADPERIDRLFRSSALMRDKWDRDDYRERTIDRAISTTRDFYDWTSHYIADEVALERIFGSPEPVGQPVEVPTQDRYEVEIRGPDERLREPFEYLRSRGMDILAIVPPPERSSLAHFRVDCPCCGGKGSFRYDLKTQSRSYCCAGVASSSWIQGVERITSGNAARLQKELTATREDMLDLVTLQGRADAIERVWLATGWIQAGHLSVLSGRSKGGKSTCAYDLITGLISGKSWMDSVETTRSPVILLDYENPVDYVGKNLQRQLQSRDVPLQDVAPLFAQIDPDLIRANASPLTVEFALDRIGRMERRTGLGNGLFLIDTAVPAFARRFTDPNWTNINVSVREALEVAQEVARKTGWHVMCIYHDSKSGQSAAGSYEWWGTPDVYLRYEREAAAAKGTLSITGRLYDPPDPLEYTFSGGLLHATPLGTARKDEADKEYQSFLTTLPTAEAKAKNQSSIMSTTLFSHIKVKQWLTNGVQAGHIESRKGDKNATLYWAKTTPGIDRFRFSN